MQHRFVILGCGHIGKKHASLAARYGKLVAVADCNQEKADILARIWNIPAYSSFTQMLLETKPDIVVVCSPNGFHAEHSIEALQSGAHVLCEKPMAICTKDADAMIEASRLFNKRLFVVKQNRFNPPVEWVKNLLNQGRLGKLHSFQLNAFWNRSEFYFKQSDWRGTLKLDGGILFTQFSHFIDLLYWYLGDLKKIHYVNAENSQHRNCIEFEDQGLAILEFESGVRGTVQYSINSFDHNMEGSISLFGEKGTVKVGGTYLNRIEYLSIEGIEPPEFPAFSANQYEGYQGSSSQHHFVYEAMLRSLSDADFSFLAPEEARQSVQIIEAIYSQMGNRRDWHE